LVGHIKAGRHAGDLHIYDSIILKWIRQHCVKVVTQFNLLRKGSSVSFRQYINESKSSKIHVILDVILCRLVHSYRCSEGSE